MFIRVEALAYKQEKNDDYDEEYNKLLEELDLEDSTVEKEKFYKEVLMNIEDFMMVQETEDGSIIDIYTPTGDIRSIHVKETLDEIETKIND